MSLRDYGRVLARRRLIVAVAVLVSTLVAIAFSALHTPIYEAEADVLIQPRSGTGLFNDQVVSVNRRAIQTEIRVIEGEAVATRVQQNLGLDKEPPEVDAIAIEDTDVLLVKVRDTNAANAQLFANAYADAYIQIRREQSASELTAGADELQVTIDALQAELDALDRFDRRFDALTVQIVGFKTTLDQLRVDAALVTGGAIVIKPAELPTTPVEPTPARSAALAAVVGLLIGVGAAFLVDYLDDKVWTTNDLVQLTEHPVLGVVPVDPPPDDRPIAMSEPAHVSAEAYRGLRTNIHFRGLDDTLDVIQVTSSLPGEGKTTTASNLAVVLAEAGHSVALVDADLRRPRLHTVFDVPPSPGLTDLLFGAAPRDVVKHVPISAAERLSLYCAGHPPSNPSEMLGGRRMRQLLAEMGAHYDYVLVDSAPILPVADSLALANGVDGVLFVVQAGAVTDDDVSGALSRLERVSAPVIGLVLNQVRTSANASAYETIFSSQRQETDTPLEPVPAE